LAAIHGVEIKDSVPKQNNRSKARSPNEGDPLIKPKAAYAHMTQEQKEAESKKIMSAFKAFFSGKGSGIGA